MVADSSRCKLCGQPVPVSITSPDGAVYCCHACREVAALLAEAPAPRSVDSSPGAAQARTTFHLGGMWCPSCGWLVEERLKRTPGVYNASVSFLERKARIDYDESRLTEGKLRRKIRSLGYRADHEADPQEEEDRFFTRMLVGGLLAMHIMVVSLIIYVREWAGLSSPDSAWLEHFFYNMQFVLSFPLTILLGLPILRAGLAGLLRGLPNVQSLVALGALAALGLSGRNLFAQSGHVYFDTAAMLFFLLTVGRWLEMKAHLAGQSAFQMLAQSLPEQARRLVDGQTHWTPVEDLQPGQRIRVLAGETVPADGVIAAGTGEIDESLLTGEAAPRLRSRDESVFAGTTAIDGMFEMVIARAGEATRLGQIRELLDTLIWERSPVEKMADRLAARLVTVAMVIAALTFAGHYFITGLETALLNSLSVLLIACPCALGIATPLTLWQAINRASENGVLLRSSAVFEKLAGVREVYFDKTGTLTNLHHRVMEIQTTGRYAEAEFLANILALEQHSVHPIGRAIVEACCSSEAEGVQVQDFRTIPGAGVIGTVNGREVHVGSRRLMADSGISIPRSLEKKAAEKQDAGDIVIFGAWEGTAHGYLTLGERLRPEAGTTLAELKHLGLQTTVLTGDTHSAGSRWQRRLGIPVKSGLLPEDKLALIRSKPGTGMMVGDGINDGPALAAAAVGAAMIHGTDVARSAAEITLMDDDLRAIPWLYRLAQETSRRLRQNLVWAGVYNAVGIALAVAGLLQPVLAALAMVLSSAFVTRNALRLRRFPSWKSGPAESGTEVLQPGLTSQQYQDTL